MVADHWDHDIVACGPRQTCKIVFRWHIGCETRSGGGAQMGEDAARALSGESCHNKRICAFT